jgi:hypothetical protein
MARYFKNPNKGYADDASYPSYAVVHDTPDTSIERSPNSEPVYPYGYVNMYHTPAKEHPNFNTKGGRKSGATELFTHKPAELHVNLMYADKRVRPHMMTVMALAKLDHPDAQIVASDTLSNFSSKLAKNAHERGLLKPGDANPDMITEDSVNQRDDYARQINTIYHVRNLKLGGGAYELTRSEVMKGKQFLKETLRPKTASPTEPSTPAPKNDQPQLPGMEDK